MTPDVSMLHVDCLVGREVSSKRRAPSDAASRSGRQEASTNVRSAVVHVTDSRREWADCGSVALNIRTAILTAGENGQIVAAWRSIYVPPF